MAQHILDHMSVATCANHVAIDLCSSLLPKDSVRSEEHLVATLGSNRFMSPGSKYDGVNLRASKFATAQAGKNVLQLHWTPIFARGRVRVYSTKTSDPTQRAPIFDVGSSRRNAPCYNIQ